MEEADTGGLSLKSVLCPWTLLLSLGLLSAAKRRASLLYYALSTTMLCFTIGPETMEPAYYKLKPLRPQAKHFVRCFVTVMKGD
jgi:hypothetical protein